MPRVLLIEDNADARDALRVLLELDGYDVEAAADGPQALELARAKAPAVALIDIGLPGMDGYEVARKLSDRMNRRKPVLIALTGYGQADDKQRAQEAGFAVHLTKPVDPQRLERIIAEAGRRRR
jgi:CheY-like chemotaxis protein